MAFRGDPDEAYDAWSQMAATDWKHLLVAGGVLEQPAALWGDVLTIEFMARRVRESQDENN